MTSTNIVVDERTDFDVSLIEDGKTFWIVTEDSNFEMCVSRAQAQTLYKLLGQALVATDQGFEKEYQERLKADQKEAFK